MKQNKFEGCGPMRLTNRHFGSLLVFIAEGCLSFQILLSYPVIHCCKILLTNAHVIMSYKNLQKPWLLGSRPISASVSFSVLPLRQRSELWKRKSVNRCCQRHVFSAGDMDRYGQIWTDMDRYGQVWTGQVWTGTFNIFQLPFMVFRVA